MLDPEATVSAETLIVEVTADAPAGVTVTVGIVDVIAEPPIVAENVFDVPDRVPVNVAEYVPLLLFVTADNVPVLVPPATARVTTPPEAVRLLPAASFA